MPGRMINDMKKCAVIVVDIQNDYFEHGANALVGAERASENAKTILEKFRMLNLPVVHIQHLATRPDATFFLPETETSTNWKSSRHFLSAGVDTTSIRTADPRSVWLKGDLSVINTRATTFDSRTNQATAPVNPAFSISPLRETDRGFPRVSCRAKARPFRTFRDLSPRVPLKSQVTLQRRWNSIRSQSRIVFGPPVPRMRLSMLMSPTIFCETSNTGSTSWATDLLPQ